MHPLTLWLTNIAEIGERERDRATIRRQRESRGDDLSPIARDGRWAAAMHRWAERSSEAKETPAAPAPAPAPTVRAAVPTARLGCA